MSLHIYNVSAIKDNIQRNKNEPNLYQKINSILKGAYTTNIDLINEVCEIIEQEDKVMGGNLRDMVVRATSAQK